MATDELLLPSVIVVPPEGAGLPSATGKGTLSPGATEMLEVNVMPPPAGCVTVTLALALATFTALAVILVDPAARLVTGTETLLAPAVKLTVSGTVATLLLLELRLTVRGVGAGAERFKVRFAVEMPLIVRVPFAKLIVN